MRYRTSLGKKSTEIRGIRRGALSVNVILVFMFLVSLVLFSMPLYRQLAYFNRDYDSLYRHDYDLASIERAFMVNAYYAIEEAYDKSKDSQEFDKLVSRENTDFYRDLIGQKYVKSPHTLYELITGDGGYYEIVKKEGYVEFYVNYYYEYKSIDRWKRKKYRLYSPFKRLEIDKSNKEKLEVKDIKSIFIELA